MWPHVSLNDMKEKLIAVVAPPPARLVFHVLTCHVINTCTGLSSYDKKRKHVNKPTVYQLVK